MSGELNDKETIQFYLLNPKDDDFNYINSCDQEYINLVANVLNAQIDLADFERKHIVASSN